MTEAGLLGRQHALLAALRRAGVPVSVAESIDAARVLTVVPLLDRAAYREALAAVVCKRAAHRPAFDALFELWFPPLLGEPRDASVSDAPTLRAELRELLLDGDDAGLRRLAVAAVSALGSTGQQGGRQSFFGYRVLRALNPQTLIAGLLDDLLAGEPRGGLAEQVVRRMVADRIAAFESYVDAEVRRRVAAERGPEAVAKTVVRPLPEDVDFLRATRDDLAELRRQVQPLARRLATRLAARRRHGHRGRLDFRRTVRASLGSGGVPVVTRHRPLRRHKPELVVLCDVSGSVAAFAQFTLLLAHALREQFTRVRAFAFVDSCDEITRFLGHIDDLPDSLARMAGEADVVWFDGHSDYGHALGVFAERWPDAVSPRSSLLVLGDGRTNYRDPGLAVLRRLVAEARHAYWLNPEPREYWGSGDSAAPAYAEVVEMVECRNAAQLTEFVRTLLPR